MTQDKRYRIEIEMAEGIDLPTAILFYQKLTVAMAKYGLTYFKDATLLVDYRELLNIRSTLALHDEMKEHIEHRRKEQMAVIQQAQRQAFGDDESEH